VAFRDVRTSKEVSVQGRVLKKSGKGKEVGPNVTIPGRLVFLDFSHLTFEGAEEERKKWKKLGKKDKLPGVGGHTLGRCGGQYLVGASVRGRSISFVLKKQNSEGDVYFTTRQGSMLRRPDSKARKCQAKRWRWV